MSKKPPTGPTTNPPAPREWAGEIGTSLSTKTRTSHGREVFQVVNINPHRPGVPRGAAGGWVETRNNITDNAWIGENATALDSSIARDQSLATGNALLKDRSTLAGHATMRENAVLMEDALADDEAILWGHSRVHGHGRARGQSILNDHTDLGGYGLIDGTARARGNTKITDRAHLGGDAEVCGLRLSGDAFIGGKGVRLKGTHTLGGDTHITAPEHHQILDPAPGLFPRFIVTRTRSRTGHQVLIEGKPYEPFTRESLRDVLTRAVNALGEAPETRTPTMKDVENTIAKIDSVLSSWTTP